MKNLVKAMEKLNEEDVHSRKCKRVCWQLFILLLIVTTVYFNYFYK